MEVFVMKSLASVLIIVLMVSSVVPDKLSTESKSGKNSQTPSSKNGTKELYSQDDTGTRRGVLPANIFLHPNDLCYTEFFAKGQPPVGFRTGANMGNIRYICQQKQLVTYFATMFDEGRGIAVYSAYTLTPANVNFQQRVRPQWSPTNGIQRQGSYDMYQNQAYKMMGAGFKILGPKYNKGHLVPAAALSSTLDGYESTFTFSNGVPQYTGFNSGPWNDFEEKIRTYATGKCIPNKGTLYLLTGTSFTDSQGNNKEVKTLLNKPDKSGIYIPNSLWTAGCCVLENGYVESFAVIGDNEQTTNTKQIKVSELQNILLADVTAIGGPAVNLFPGVKQCAFVNADKI